jgi:hypothetical protein
VWGLFLLAVFMSCFFRNASAPWRDELAVLIPLLLIFTFMSRQDGFSINPRYIVLVLPLLYIFVSKAASSTTICCLLSAIFFAWIVGSSLSFYPCSMSYFNELAGKPTNYIQNICSAAISTGGRTLTL